MTATKAAPAPSTYVTGLCSARRHDRCRGTYAGTTCTCSCHTEPEPEPAPAPPLPVPARHCATCTCGDPR